MTGPVIELKSVERHYVQGARKLTILSGADFAPLHELFERHHAQQEEAIDAIAERIQHRGS